MLSSVFKNWTNCSDFVLSFFYLYYSSAGNVMVYTPSQGANRERVLTLVIHQGRNADSGGQ